MNENNPVYYPNIKSIYELSENKSDELSETHSEESETSPFLRKNQDKSNVLERDDQSESEEKNPAQDKKKDEEIKWLKAEAKKLGLLSDDENENSPTPTSANALSQNLLTNPPFEKNSDDLSDNPTTPLLKGKGKPSSPIYT